MYPIRLLGAIFFVLIGCGGPVDDGASRSHRPGGIYYDYAASDECCSVMVYFVSGNDYDRLKNKDYLKAAIRETKKVSEDALCRQKKYIFFVVQGVGAGLSFDKSHKVGLLLESRRVMANEVCAEDLLFEGVLTDRPVIMRDGKLVWFFKEYFSGLSCKTLAPPSVSGNVSGNAEAGGRSSR